MGKGGRIACIFTPFVLTLASLICIVLIFLGGSNKSSSTLEQYHFFKADLTNFTTSPDLNLIDGTNIDNTVLSNALGSANASANLKQYYAVYLWNYCAGNGPKAANNEFSFCSPRQQNFWFNPVEVWGLNNTAIEQLFPTQLQNGLKAYQKVSHWMFVAYLAALITTIAELVIGIFAICSRWGSFFTTLVSGFSTLFIIAASLTATLLFSTLTATFNTALRPYGIHGSLGRPLLTTTWLAVAFSVLSGAFWFLSVCCCSGRSPYHKDSDRYSGGGGNGMRGLFAGSGRKNVTVEKTPYTYERVESPYLGPQQHQHATQSGVTERFQDQQQHQNVPMINLQRASRDMEGNNDHYSHSYSNATGGGGGGAYEPFRRS